MKRVISFLLCVIMAFLCACNSQVNSDQLTAAQKLNNEPELTQQQADRLVDLMAKLESYRGGGAVQKQVKAELEKVEWVEKVEETEDGGLTCYTDFGVTAVWTPDPKKEKLEDLKQIKLETTLSSSEVAVKQIAILCPYASTEPDFNADDYVALGKDLGGSISCNVTVFKDEEVSLDLMKNLGKYDMVWIRTLGGINCLFDSTLALIGKESYIMIGEKVATAEDCIKHSADFLRGRIVLNLRDGRLGISGKFFEHHYGADALAGTFFHIAANFSMKTNAFADALISRGAVWVEGWSGEVNYNNDYVQFANVVSGLLKGKSVEQAVKDASNAVKSSDSFYQSNCTLIGKGDVAYDIKGVAVEQPTEKVTETVTEPVTQKPEKPNAPEWASSLTEGYWENNIQSRKVYKFNKDGTVDEYDIEEDAEVKTENLSLVSHSEWTYYIKGENLYMDFGVGTIVLTWISQADKANLSDEQKIGLPKTGSFFYEYGGDSGDPSDEEFYLKKCSEPNKTVAETTTQKRPEPATQQKPETTTRKKPTTTKAPTTKAPTTKVPTTKVPINNSTVIVGKYITFGSYEQDNNLANGKEPIEWLVLEKKGGKALVISKHALDWQQYNTDFEEVTWETCTLRKWLNDEFINSAFTSSEKSRIPTVTVTADVNPSCDTDPGNDTQDRVFLLSIDEANEYFDSDEARKCTATHYAQERGVWQAYDWIGCAWWLRSPGNFQEFAANGYEGYVDSYGSSVSGSNIGVRPAMWITL